MFKYRYILITLSMTQQQALLSLRDTWSKAADPAALTTYPLAQRVAHQPVLRAAEWLQFGELRAEALVKASQPLLMLLGQEIFYWSEHGDHLMLPGVPDLLPVTMDSGETYPIHRERGVQYGVVSGLVAVHEAPASLSQCVPEGQIGILLVAVEFNPGLMGGPACA